SGVKDYRVVTAPPWYIIREGIEFRLGISYEVTGSKYIARDGNIYIVASRLKDLSSGKITPPQGFFRHASLERTHDEERCVNSSLLNFVSVHVKKKGPRLQSRDPSAVEE
ncbi:MAG TPA: hypothetical protein VLD55_00440, partial [Candidatus Sulfobium mesophilum]|nr:hypothetical protein [Candidatus Sulfobium mesophilum]